MSSDIAALWLAHPGFDVQSAVLTIVTDIFCGFVHSF